MGLWCWNFWSQRRKINFNVVSLPTITTRRSEGKGGEGGEHLLLGLGCAMLAWGTGILFTLTSTTEDYRRQDCRTLSTAGLHWCHALTISMVGALHQTIDIIQQENTRNYLMQFDRNCKPGSLQRLSAIDWSKVSSKGKQQCCSIISGMLSWQ